MGELAVFREGGDAEVDRLVVRLVGDVFLDQHLDHRDHLGDVLVVGRRRVVVGGLDVERLQVLEERVFELLRELGQRDPGLARIADRLVIDVRQVHHALHLVAAHLEVALQEVFKNVGAEVADVGETVDGRPAGVHLDELPVRVDRHELLDAAGVRIVESDRHRVKTKQS